MFIKVETLVLAELLEYVLWDMEALDEFFIISLYPLYLVSKLLYLIQ